MLKKKINKKNIIFICIGIFFLIVIGGFYFNRNSKIEKNKNQGVSIVEKYKEEKEDLLEKAKKKRLFKEDEERQKKERARKVIKDLNTEYNVEDTLIAYLDSPLIKEPVAHSKTIEDFMRTTPDGKYYFPGTVALYYQNKNIEDDVITLLGHTLEDPNIKFSPLVSDTNRFLKEMKEIKLITKNGEKKYKLVLYKSLKEETLEEDIDFLSHLGLRDLKKEKGFEEFYRDEGENFDKKDKFLNLITCRTPDASYRTIAVYKEIKERN